MENYIILVRIGCPRLLSFVFWLWSFEAPTRRQHVSFDEMLTSLWVWGSLLFGVLWVLRMRGATIDDLLCDPFTRDLHTEKATQRFWPLFRGFGSVWKGWKLAGKIEKCLRARYWYTIWDQEEVMGFQVNRRLSNGFFSAEQIKLLINRV